MSLDSVKDVVDLLHRRSEFLDALSRGASGREEVADRVGVSGSTAYRALRELRGHGLIGERGEGLALTTTGELMRECYEKLVGDVDAVLQFRDIASAVPPEDELSVEPLRGGEAVYPDRHDPFKPVSKLKEIAEGADRVKGFTPVVAPQYVEVLHGRAVGQGRRTEVMLERETAERLASRFPDTFGEAAESDCLEVRLVDSEFPYGLVVAEGDRSTTGVMVYDDAGEIRGLLRNDSPDAARWADEVYRRYREGSEPLEL